MSIISKIPDDSRARYPVVRFESDPLDGFADYDWENAGNTNVTLMDDVTPGAVYLIERINFFANASESDWLESMKTPADFPRISIRFSRIGGGSIFADPFRCVNYVDNAEQLVYFRTSQKDDTIVASMYGKVAQVPGMVGKLTLLAQANFTIYEIRNAAWLKIFESDPARLGLTLRV